MEESLEEKERRIIISLDRLTGLRRKEANLPQAPRDAPGAESVDTAEGRVEDGAKNRAIT